MRQVKFSLLAAVLSVISPQAQASGPSISITQLPQPGHAQKFDLARYDNSGFSPRTIDGVVAGRALAKLAQANVFTTRGAADAEIYRRFSPSVVIVLTKDALGSGSFISADGLILTCNHVVAGYSKVGILLKPAQEGQRADANAVLIADVIKTDEVSDLALLKLEQPNSSTIAFFFVGDFSKVSVGDDVHAIGHPTGEMWTYTKGYVSQIRRGYQWTAEDGLAHSADVIQTQTPINPGNSGGPLLNSAGALIGVNAFKDAGEGLNFAIGSDEISKFIHRPASRVAQAGSPPTACQAHVLFEGRNQDNTASIRQTDVNCHGKPDLTLVVPDDQRQPIYMVVTTSETDMLDGMIISLHRDGKWNISYWDSKRTGKWDTIGYHPDGNVVPSSYGPYVEN